MFIAIALPCLMLAMWPEALATFGWHAADWADRPWTLLTAHLVHLDTRHLLANLAALAALLWVAASLRLSAAALRARDTIAMLGGAWVAVCAGLLSGIWEIGWYAGLSGLLYGLFAGLAFTLARRPGVGWLGLALLAGGLVKVVLDLRAGVGAVGGLGVALVPPAHVCGFLGGLLSAIGLARATPLRQRDR